ncbi:HlyD family efflux transporter periplasmic adaptor subunit [Campylobacter sp. TTU_617]|nr:HlyD family efflux transporter periplasmic adaptor subunit [Campylobacter sp. TTU_617]
MINVKGYKANVNSAYGKVLTAKANFDSAKANLTSARADLASAKIDLNYTQIVAPFDGVIGDALINIGDFVSASTTELVRVTNLNPIYADFYISDTDKLNLNRNIQTKVVINSKLIIKSYNKSFDLKDC